MRFVRVEERDEPRGYFLSATEYRKELPRLQAELPPGAWAFASDVDHYDFYSERCVKDLKLLALAAAAETDGLSAVARFGFNDFAPEYLMIRYVSVVNLFVNVDIFDATSKPNGDACQLGPLQLDEVLPHAHGCEHEIKFIGGNVRVVCADLIASWVQR